METLVGWQSATPMPNLEKQSKDPEWERKQRAREYRVAARREKRNRKADEKKQRKLNATILRRMTRNPDKYTKNAERNRLRAIEGERRAIWSNTLKQVQRLAAIHDPTGKMFNIGPVTTREDGLVISLEAMRRQEERTARLNLDTRDDGRSTGHPLNTIIQATNAPDMKPDRLANISQPKGFLGKNLSKTQQKKLAALEPRPPPPKPTIPEGISLPKGEVNWLALWDLSDDQLERRVLRSKKQKAAERKALRIKQQSGKAERRAARDEKRRVYRELKMTWKLIREDEKKHKTSMKGAEDEEAKRIAVEIADHERKAAMERCAELGFTLINTPGVQDVKPRVLGTKGQTIDFEALEIDEPTTDIRPKTIQANKRRVDLSTIPQSSDTYIAPAIDQSAQHPDEYIRLDVDDGQDFQALSYNHKLRRKIRRALDAAQIRRELLVRERTRQYCEENGLVVPIELSTPANPVHERGQRVQEQGLLETAKRERVRHRLELAEFNKAARVLRKQAKQLAMEAGLRVYAEMTGRIEPRDDEDKEQHYGIGWHKTAHKG